MSEHFQASTRILTIASFPAELVARDQWVAWKLIQRKTNKKPTKIPYDAKTGGSGSSTNPKTWASLNVALERLRQGGYDGVGYVFAEEDPYTGIDLDHALSAAGELEPWARPIVKAFASYTELSPSRTGLHIIVRGVVPDGIGHRTELRKTPLWREDAHPDAAIEMYSSGRFFTMTGEVWHD
jgi:primase-polymerase (primpol)-like protein